MKKKISLRVALILGLLAVVLLAKYFGLTEYLKLNYIKENLDAFASYYENHQVLSLALFFIVYVVVTALSLPGAAVLTLVAGALFGFVTGTVLVSFASTIGASLAFVGARFLLRDSIEHKFSKQFQKINEGVKKQGAFYLFSLRLVPIIPFFVINAVMGLTQMRLWTFYWVSQVGMLAGTMVYVNAGKQLASIDALSEVMSLNVLLSCAALALLPWLTKAILKTIKTKKIYKNYSKPKHFDYNMVVIGAGSAGLVTAYISAAVKAKVALIEKNKMGGDCLNTGCVPSKAIIKSAKLAYQMQHASEYGLEDINPSIDFKKIMQRVQQVIKDIEPHDSVERYTKLGVECIKGAAKIISPWEVEVNGKILSTRNITIATGASPFVPALEGIDQITALTSENLWQLPALPKKLIVLGGGPIGCEMAQSFARLGSQVTQVEMMDRLMGIEDEAVSKILQEQFEKEGIEVLTQHQAQAVVIKDGKKYLQLKCQNQTIEKEFDELLVAVGRRANIKGFGLEEMGIQLRENKTIEANAYLQTNFPNIYVCGDVTGPYQLTHTASHQAWYCAVNALFGKFKKYKVDYSVIPWATYTDPEIATVGLNEQQAKKQGISYTLTTYAIDDLDRAIADSENRGMVRVLTKPGTDKIIGASIVGQHAADLIIEFIAAMKHGFGLNKILSTIHIYPTMAEANKFVAGNWKKQQTQAYVFKWLKKFHAWQR
ncbi:MAG TPA: dihydrolipoyl dehydrogenase [Oligoflexia bacterium]|nr:dihydrolipoyl dehydrogenase [Oligoflexia bacterium]HMR25065.1 dihydrolipoyl dehydrogenase [Oligoflexia bacterium]